MVAVTNKVFAPFGKSTGQMAGVNKIDAIKDFRAYDANRDIRETMRRKLNSRQQKTSAVKTETRNAN